jgi:hypothetical protein
MGRRALLAAATACGWAVATPSPAAADGYGRFVVDPGGRVRSVRAVDVDGDRRADLVLVVQPAGETPKPDEVVVLRTPKTPAPGEFFAKADVVRIPATGDLGACGAVAIGRFVPGGKVVFRFLGPNGAVDVDPSGKRLPAEPRTQVPTLLARSEHLPLAVWRGHADLDGDGVEEVWFPDAEGDGAVRVLGGTPAADRRLALDARNLGGHTEEHAWLRTAWAPTLVAADLDGDGRRELVGLRGKSLVAWATTGAADAGGRAPPSTQVALSFLDDVPLGPEQIRTPRVQLADVDGDRVADLLATIVTGRRDQLGSLRTTLYHFPGPFRDPATGGLVAPRARIDTESVALHPRYVDLDGDGALDYVSDSIRGTRLDLIQRVLGKEPEITFVGFRFDRATGTFETTPYFTAVRGYARAQAVSNAFGISGAFEGDFDGDGHRDLLDLGNLEAVEVLGAVRKTGAGPGDPVAFSREVVRRTKAPKPLEPQAVIEDLDGDGRPEAVVWNDASLFVIASGGGR